jgi:HK97 gp10 family phage protein
MTKLKFNVNSQKLEKNLNTLKTRIARGAMRDALKKASKPMLDEAKRGGDFSDRTGTLRKSLKVKMSTNTKTNDVFATIGPDKNVKSTTTDEFTGETIEVKPVKYAHLVEFGHRLVSAAGKAYGRIKAYPFMRKAFDSQSENVIKIYRQELGNSIEKIARKLQSK